MKLKFYANACCVYESQGQKILCDPWLVDGAFGGSWFHFPPLTTKPQDVADYDYLYLSHLHPDHFDIKTLEHFDKSKPVVILDHGGNYLEKVLMREGFFNLVKIQDADSVYLGPFTVTMFAPFTKHPFHETQLGNLIDSAMLVDADGFKILNTNDNTPDLYSADLIKKVFGRVDIAQLNYNAAGPYPACFQNLSDDEKLSEHERLLTRNIDHMGQVAQTLQARYVMPFAGAYVLGGRNWSKNRFLGTTTQDEAKRRLLKSYNMNVLCMNEGQTFNLESDTLDTEYKPTSLDKAWEYVSGELSGKRYEYESGYNTEGLWERMTLARGRFLSAWDRMGRPRLPTITVNGFEVFTGQGRLECKLDERLLSMILDRREHWNNAEIGCLIEFDRKPNDYCMDAHTLMSFFHV